MRPAAEQPAAAEDIEALFDQAVSPWTGRLIATLCTLFVVVLVWLAWARVGEVVHAPGRVEPAGRVKVINHPLGGRVAEVHVHDGQRVEAGEPLVTFDPGVTEGEHAELLGRWQTTATEVARLDAEAGGRTLVTVDEELANRRPDLVDAQARLLQARSSALTSRRDALTKAVETRRSELRSADAETVRLRQGLELMHGQLDAVQELADRGLYPRLKLIGVQREVGDGEGALRKAEADMGAATAALAEARTRLDGLDRDWHSEVLSDLARATAERDRLREELRGEETRLAETVVRAPVSGIVDALAITAPGQAVGPTDELMKLVPADEGLVVEARVANEDIGRVALGMSAPSRSAPTTICVSAACMASCRRSRPMPRRTSARARRATPSPS